MFYRTEFTTDKKDFLNLVNKLAEARGDVVDLATHLLKLPVFIPEDYHYPNGFEKKLDKLMRRSSRWLFGYNEEAYWLEAILDRNQGTSDFTVTDVEIGQLSGLFISAEYFLREPAKVSSPSYNSEMLEQVTEVVNTLVSSRQLDNETIEALNNWEQELFSKTATLRVKLNNIRGGYFTETLLPMLQNFNRSLWQRVDRP